MTLLWIKAHFEELLHQVLLWHWAWFTMRHLSEFTLISVEHSTHMAMVTIWGWTIFRHFRRRLCNKKLQKSEV